MAKETLSLTISIDEGRLFVLLSDTKRLSTHGWARTDLQNIRQVAAAVEPSVLQELVFPSSVNEAIKHSNADNLHVQIQPELAFLPVEAFRSAEQRWCDRFAMSCYLQGVTPTNLPEHQSNSISSDRIHVCMTDSLIRSELTAVLDHQLGRQGLLLTEYCADQDATTVLIADSVNDAAQHLRIHRGSSPAICVWTADYSTEMLGEHIAEFNQEFPGSAVLTGHSYCSIEDLTAVLTPVLAALNTGLTPSCAVQKATVEDSNSHQTLRLYNCDDVQLCQTLTVKPIEAENRTITALSLDVVASTRMMHRLGNERYSDVLATLKEQCIKFIYEHGGSSGGRAGDDSTMAYFGLPNALESAAGCAMETALAVRAMLPNLPGQPELRIGIATGRVAVRSGIPYGEAIHLAARLQSFGQPGDIIVDTASQWLARQDYQFEPCGDYTTFHGIESPVLPARLIDRMRDKSPGSEFDSTVPFIGRSAELMELVQSWQQVCEGEQKVVCIRGEAGIGKSRLVSEFLAMVLPDEGRSLTLRGLSDYQGGAFYSLKESLKRGFGFQAGDTHAQVKRRVLEAGSLPPLSVSNICQVAQMLGVTDIDSMRSTHTRATTHSTDSGIREHLFNLLTEAIDAAARDKPLVLMVEDAQWLDPSAREALEHTLDVLYGRSGLSLLVLCTERDDQAYKALPNAQILTLNRLASQHAHQLIRKLVGDNLASDVVDQLVARADGVPLYLEESARLALDQPAGMSSLVFNIPDSINSLLMSRLDSLNKSGKYLVQIASAIGRDIQIELLRIVLAQLTDSYSLNDFHTHLGAFRKLGILNDLKAKGPARLTFRHEMIRDVAYMSMWERDRIAVHAAVAQVMLNDQDQLFVTQPGIIAGHLSQSEQHEQAAAQWEAAARLAAGASANQETIQNLRSALQSLKHLMNSEHTDRQEMRLQLMLAARLIACEGYGAEEVKCAYERAQVLVNQFGDIRDQLKVTLGLETVHVMRGELETAQVLASSALAQAEKLPKQKARMPMLIQARWALGNVKFHQGQSSEALCLMDQCIEDCCSTGYRASAVQDPEIMCLCYGAWALWEKGLFDTAVQRVARAVELSRTRRHRFSEGEALGFYASIAMHRGEYETAIAYAEEAISICEQEKFVIWLAHARVIRGRSRALATKCPDALAEMEQGYDDWVATGAVITRAFYLSLIAETLFEMGEIKAASQRADQAYELISRSGDQYHLAEILRIQGLIAYSDDNYISGDSLMQRAISTAQAQEKQTFVLRASTAWAESLVSRARGHDAVVVLNEALSPMLEGMSTSDPARACALLTSWSVRSGSNAFSLYSPRSTTDIGKYQDIPSYAKSAND